MRLVIIVLLVFLLATSGWAGTLKDDFGDGNFEGWRIWKFGNQSAKWFVKEGKLIGVSTRNCGITSDMIIGDETWKNYEIEVQFKVEKTFIPRNCPDRGAVMGVGVHYDEASGINLAAFGVSTREPSPNWDKVFCEFFIQGVGQNTHAGDFTTIAGKWYTVKFVVNENRYEVFIDDKPICEFLTGLPEKGGAGMFVLNSEVHFDNVRITGDDVPDMNLSVTPKAKLTTTWGRLKGY